MKKTVKVVLLQPVPSLGQKNDLKSVKLGFAKNFLLPRKLAMVATPMLVTKLQQQQAFAAKKVAQEQEQFGALIDTLKGFTLKLRPKKTTKGTLYEGIDSKTLIAKLREKKIALDEKYLQLTEPLKKVGEYEIPIVFTKDYQTSITVVIQ